MKYLILLMLAGCVELETSSTAPEEEKQVDQVSNDGPYVGSGSPNACVSAFDQKIGTFVLCDPYWSYKKHDEDPFHSQVERKQDAPSNPLSEIESSKSRFSRNPSR